MKTIPQVITELLIASKGIWFAANMYAALQYNGFTNQQLGSLEDFPAYAKANGFQVTPRPFRGAEVFTIALPEKTDASAFQS